MSRRQDDLGAFADEMKATVDGLIADGAGRGDVKMLRTALKELRHCFRVMHRHRGRRKVSVFGSARTKPDDPSYKAAEEFGRRAAAADLMVITGAAAGIMEAGHVGAGREHSIGLNIVLPFEQKANPVIEGDSSRLMHLRYFFTRKLLFMKESHAIALFPGGFGTHDEGFEALTLIQTGKNPVIPVILIEEPGGDYWKKWLDFVTGCLLRRGMISPSDENLWLYTHSADEAVNEIMQFYRVYHSSRYVRDKFVMRLQEAPPEELMERIQTGFADILAGGRFELAEAHEYERNEEHLMSLPRLSFRFNRASHGRLRALIDLLNRGA